MLVELTQLLEYKKHFDGLRFLLFLPVFFSHALGGSHFFPLWPNAFTATLARSGLAGLFVLSGFLITRILERSDTGSLSNDLPLFYLRRTLRIFPIYYATLLVLLLAGVLKDPVWYFSYLYNWRVFTDGYGTGFGQFWSLSVEEQFYLLFPLIFLCTRREWRLRLILALLAFSNVCAFLFGSLAPGKDYFILLPVCGQYIFWGCLAGYVDLAAPRHLSFKAALWLGFIFWAGLSVLELSNPQGLRLTLMPLKGLCIAAFIIALWRTTNTVLIRVLSQPILAYFGKTSYAMYLFHVPILLLLGPLLGSDHRILKCLAITIGLAALSWQFFESPINKYRNRFHCKPRREPAKALVSSKQEVGVT